jgi:ATP-binding cassette subfamily F protein uup
MDRVVDHLLVFKGGGRVDDFPGNYTQYREWESLQESTADAEDNRPSSSSRPASTDNKKGADNGKTGSTRGGEKRRRLSWNERKEMERLEQEIAALETEQHTLETELCSGALNTETLTAHSIRLPQLQAELDEKSMRWLELSEIEA